MKIAHTCKNITIILVAIISVIYINEFVSNYVDDLHKEEHLVQIKTLYDVTGESYEDIDKYLNYDSTLTGYEVRLFLEEYYKYLIQLGAIQGI